MKRTITYKLITLTLLGFFSTLILSLGFTWLGQADFPPEAQTNQLFPPLKDSNQPVDNPPQVTTRAQLGLSLQQTVYPHAVVNQPLLYIFTVTQTGVGAAPITFTNRLAASTSDFTLGALTINGQSAPCTYTTVEVQCILQNTPPFTLSMVITPTSTGYLFNRATVNSSLNTNNQDNTTIAQVNILIPLNYIFKPAWNLGHPVLQNEPIGLIFSEEPNNITPQTFEVWGQQTGLYSGEVTPLDPIIQGKNLSSGSYNRSLYQTFPRGDLTINNHLAEMSYIFVPHYPFQPGEKLRVHLHNVSLVEGNIPLSPTTWIARAQVITGSGYFSPTWQAPVSTTTPALAWGDLNGDRALDYIALNQGAADTVWLNNGQGSFTQYTTLPTTNSLGIILGDIDRDGDLDALIGTDNGSTPWLNNGDGNLTSCATLGSGTIPGLALEDIDGDGDLDALLGGNAQPDALWDNIGNCIFTLKQTLTTTPNNQTNSISTGDFNNDGLFDLIIINTTNPHEIWLNDGNGNLNQPTTLPNNGTATSVAVGDLDKDGDVDLVIAYNGTPDTILFNDGHGQFFPGPGLSVNNNTTRLMLADVDADTDLDIISAKDNQPLTIQLNQGDNTFSPTNQLLPALVASDLAIGDGDGDGDLDILLSQTGGTIHLWLNNPQADFSISASTAKPHQSITFQNTSSGTIKQCTWDFGDGTTSDNCHATHQYSQHGSYTVRLTVEGGGQDEITKTINILAADFTVSPRVGAPPLLTTFTLITTQSNYTNVTWDFGDGTIINTHPSTVVVTHQYTQSGLYTATLIVEHNGITASKIASIFISNSLWANFEAQVIPPDTNPRPLATQVIPHQQGTTVRLTNLTAGNYTDVLWDFGDDTYTTTTESIVNHTYQRKGTYQIVLTVSNTTTIRTKSNNITIPNHVPEITDLTLTYATDGLVLDYNQLDPDEDADETRPRWFRNNQLQPGLNGSRNVSSTLIIPGDEWCTRVTPFDGEEYGLNSTEICQTIPGEQSPNIPPRVQTAHLKPDTPLHTYDDLTLTINLTDPDTAHHLLSSTINWIVDGQTHVDLQNQHSISKHKLALGQTWCAIIHPYDGERHGPAYRTNCVIIRSVDNHYPVIKEATLSPTVPISGDSLSLDYIYDDAYGEAEIRPTPIVSRDNPTTQIRWYRNNRLEIAFNNQRHITPNLTLPNESWYATIHPFDGRTYGLVYKTDPITFATANATPQLKDITLNALYLGSDTPIDLAYTFIDDGFEQEESEIIWYRNNQPQPHLDGLTYVPTAYTQLNDRWHAVVTPKDSQGVSGAKGIPYTVIITNTPSLKPQILSKNTASNHPPIAYDVKIIPGEPNENQTLTAQYQFLDADGDPEKKTQIIWYLFDPSTNRYIEQTAIGTQSLTVPASTPRYRDRWYVEVIPHDGKEYGLPVKSALVVINRDPATNTPPQISNLRIEPNRPSPLQIMAVWYEFSDPDGDQEGDTKIWWYRNNTLMTEFNNQLIVHKDKTLPGEEWFVIVLPHDGLDVGDLTLSEINKINNPPFLNPQPNISPDPPKDYQNLYVTYRGYTDEDFDPPTNISEIRWYKKEESQTQFITQTQFNDLSILSYIHTDPGQAWSATVTVFDGIDYGDPAATKVLTIVVKNHPVFIPLLMKSLPRIPPIPTPDPCSIDRNHEPNNIPSEACEIQEGRLYSLIDDETDMYYIDLPHNSKIDINLSNYPDGGTGQLRLYEAIDSNLIGKTILNNETGQIESDPLPPGRYYIQVYITTEWLEANEEKIPQLDPYQLEVDVTQVSHAEWYLYQQQKRHDLP